MVDFNPKKLQVFVSSTYTDLIEERQAAVMAILNLGHIPAGMELFTSGDESQMEVIKAWIDESDVFLLILGGRYGSLEPKTRKSYTHLEYEYAVKQAKPFFACVVSEEGLDAKVEKGGRKCLEEESSEKMRDFRDLVLTKNSEFWDDHKDIQLTIASKLAQLARREELVGWTRPSKEGNVPALADEVVRLNQKIEKLRLEREKYLGVQSTLPAIHKLVVRNGIDGLVRLLVDENTTRFLPSQARAALGLSSMEIGVMIKKLVMFGVLEKEVDNFQRYVVSEKGKDYLVYYMAVIDSE